MLLAGLMAGGLTTASALHGRPPDGPPGDPAVAASLAALPARAAPPAPAPVAVGTLRVHEAALADAYHRRLEAETAASRSRAVTPGAFLRPTAGARTGWFGERRRSHLHPGIDYDGETGDPVIASGHGLVTYAGTAPSGYSGYGQMVLVEHGNGITTLYAHLSRIDVGAGMEIAAGERVGAIGTTGSVTGSHLHFELRLEGRPVDPAGWIAG